MLPRSRLAGRGAKPTGIPPPGNPADWACFDYQ